MRIALLRQRMIMHQYSTLMSRIS